MSKRTLILIVFLTLLTAFFVYLAVSQNKSVEPSKPVVVEPTKKPSVAFTTLQLQEQKAGAVAVMINTNGEKNKVTAVQLELSYDPQKLSNVRITPGPFIGAAVPLISTIDQKTGRVTYALAISPSGEGKTGEGILATISFQSFLPTGASTEIKVLPETLVTAEGITESVLLKGTGITVTSISSSAGQIKVVPSVSTTP